MHKYQAMELFIDQIEATKEGKIELTSEIWKEFKENIKYCLEEEMSDVLMQIELRTKVNPVFLAEYFEAKDTLSQEELLSFI